MVDSDPSVLVIIPARGGSKRLPGKNILPMNGKPLIGWTIEKALLLRYRLKVVVSSDDQKILEVANKYQDQRLCVHQRPLELAQDDSPTIDTLLDVIDSECVNGFNPDLVVLLQPTSPLRSVDDILGCIALFMKHNFNDSVISVTPMDHPTSWVGSIDNDGSFLGVDFSSKRSQDYKNEYRVNGAIYVFSPELVKNTMSIYSEKIRAFIMPYERSIDIDNLIDFKQAEFFQKNNSF